MKNEVVQRIVLSEDEALCIKKATEIVTEISRNHVPSYMLDVQELPDCIKKLTREVLLMDSQLVYSVLNVLTDDAKNRVIKEAFNLIM